MQEIEKIEKILEFFGTEAQMIQLVKEIEEMLEESKKLLVLFQLGILDIETLKRVVEEFADVGLVTHQLMIENNIDANVIEIVQKFKAERTMRIIRGIENGEGTYAELRAKEPDSIAI